MEPMSFAIMCIEVNAESKQPDSLNVEVFNEDLDHNVIVEVLVDYANKPSSCSSCGIFGHSADKCPKANYKWVPKAKSNPEDNPNHFPKESSSLDAPNADHNQPLRDKEAVPWTLVSKRGKDLSFCPY